MRHICGMRRAVLVVAWLACGCPGVNPEWDGPVPVSSEPHVGETSDVDPSETSASSSSAASSSAVESGAAESETTSENENENESTGDSTSAPVEPSTGDATSSGPGPAMESSSEGPPPPMCPMNQTLCGDECKDTMHDKKACGPDCVDCTDLYDNHARCEEGECQPEEGKAGD